MKKKLFMIAILYHPTNKDTRLLLAPTPVLAVDYDTAKLDAFRSAAIPSNISSDQLEVIVRPF